MACQYDGVLHAWVSICARRRGRARSPQRVSWISLIWVLPWLGWLLYVRRYFGKARGPRRRPEIKGGRGPAAGWRTQGRPRPGTDFCLRARGESVPKRPKSILDIMPIVRKPARNVTRAVALSVARSNAGKQKTGYVGGRPVACPRAGHPTDRAGMLRAKRIDIYLPLLLVEQLNARRGQRAGEPRVEAPVPGHETAKVARLLGPQAA